MRSDQTRRKIAIDAALVLAEDLSTDESSSCARSFVVQARRSARVTVHRNRKLPRNFDRPDRGTIRHTRTMRGEKLRSVGSSTYKLIDSKWFSLPRLGRRNELSIRCLI